MPKGKPVNKIESEADKRQHFKDVVLQSTKILERQLKKLEKIPRGRTYSYTQEQIEQLEEWLNKRVEEVIGSLKGKVEEDNGFTFE